MEMSSYEKEDIRVTKKICHIVLIAIASLIAIICLFRCFYSVDEQHNAIVSQFGDVVRIDTAGFYVKAPWQSVTKIDMTTHGTGIGYTVSEDGQNITDDENGIMITSDFNLLNIDFYLEYKVSDPLAYACSTSNPEGIMINIAKSNIRTVVSNYTVDESITTGKSQIQADIKAAMLEDLASSNTGLTVVNITIQDSEPSTAEIIAAFKSVETAKQGADTAMNNALQYQNSQIPAAKADADAIIQTATAAKESRIAEANGQVERFNKLYAEYVQFPEITKKRLFYEKMEEILPGVRVIITDGDTQTIYPLDEFSTVNTSTTTSSNTNED